MRPRRPPAGIRTSAAILALALVAGAGAAACGEERLPAAVPAPTAPQPVATTAPATVMAAGAATTPAAPPTPAARVVVTRDFGATAVAAGAVTPGRSVIASLQAIATVKTAYGGGFVQAIDGLAGSQSGARDWLYLVNGIEADVGGLDYTLRDGDETWWDYRRWGGRLSTPVLVGAWPEPFVHGYGGDAPAAVTADPPLDAALRAAGAPVVAAAAGDGVRYRVLVGADTSLRARDAAWRRAAGDPDAAGLTAWIADGVVRVWDGAAGAPVDVPGATAVVAATLAGESRSDGVVLVVAGLDADAATAAATAVAADPSLLARRFAVALDATGAVVASGGRGLG